MTSHVTINLVTVDSLIISVSKKILINQCPAHHTKPGHDPRKNVINVKRISRTHPLRNNFSLTEINTSRKARHTRYIKKKKKKKITVTQRVTQTRWITRRDDR